MRERLGPGRGRDGRVERLDRFQVEESEAEEETSSAARFTTRGRAASGASHLRGSGSGVRTFRTDGDNSASVGMEATPSALDVNSSSLSYQAGRAQPIRRKKLRPEGCNRRLHCEIRDEKQKGGGVDEPDPGPSGAMFLSPAGHNDPLSPPFPPTLINSLPPSSASSRSTSVARASISSHAASLSDCASQTSSDALAGSGIGDGYERVRTWRKDWQARRAWTSVVAYAAEGSGSYSATGLQREGAHKGCSVSETTPRKEIFPIRRTKKKSKSERDARSGLSDARFARDVHRVALCERPVEGRHHGLGHLLLLERGRVDVPACRLRADNTRSTSGWARWFMTSRKGEHTERESRQSLALLCDKPKERNMRANSPSNLAKSLRSALSAPVRLPLQPCPVQATYSRPSPSRCPRSTAPAPSSAGLLRRRHLSPLRRLVDRCGEGKDPSA